MALADAGGAIAATAELTAEVAGLERQVAQAAAELAAVEDQHRVIDARAASAARARRAGEDELARLAQRAAVAAQRADEAAHGARGGGRGPGPRGAGARRPRRGGPDDDRGRGAGPCRPGGRGRGSAGQRRSRPPRRPRSCAAAEARHAALKAQLDALAAPSDPRPPAGSRRPRVVVAGRWPGGSRSRPSCGRRWRQRLAPPSRRTSSTRGTSSPCARDGATWLCVWRPPRSTRRAGPSLERAREAGGGALTEAIRRDPTGVAGQLLRTTVWLPSLEAALAAAAPAPRGLAGGQHRRGHRDRAGPRQGGPTRRRAGAARRDRAADARAGHRGGHAAPGPHGP